MECDGSDSEGWVHVFNYWNHNYPDAVQPLRSIYIQGEHTMGKFVVIDTDECIGCESCVELCAEVFAFNEEEEKAEVILPQGGPEDCIEEAMETCPTECIRYEE